MMNEEVLSKIDEILPPLLEFATKYEKVAIAFLLAAFVFVLLALWKLDLVEKEPLPLLAGLLVLGIVAYIVIPFVTRPLSNFSFLSAYTSAGELKDYDALKNSLYLRGLCVALIEEGIKLVLLLIVTWKSKHFNEIFDGIMYSMFLAAGFAGCNACMSYIGNTSSWYVILSAFINLLAPLVFAFIFGCFYSRAKMADVQNHKASSCVWILLGYILVSLLYSFYYLPMNMKRYHDSPSAKMVWYIMTLVSIIIGVALIMKKSKKSYLSGWI